MSNPVDRVNRMLTQCIEQFGQNDDQYYWLLMDRFDTFARSQEPSVVSETANDIINTLRRHIAGVNNLIYCDYFPDPKYVASQHEIQNV